MRVVRNTENEITIEVDEDFTVIVKPDMILTKTVNFFGDVDTRKYSFEDLEVMSDAIRTIIMGSFDDKDAKIAELQKQIKELKAQKPTQKKLTPEEIQEVKTFFAELQKALLE